MRSFIAFAIDKLYGAAEALEDEDPEDNFEELCSFTTGLSRALKNTGAKASGELKGQLSEGLANVWNLRSDEPGEDLSVDALRAALEALVAEDGPLAAEESTFEDQDDEETKPENLEDMSLQDAVTHMWTNLDKPNRCEWGEDGFTLDLGRKGRYNSDACDGPLFTCCNQDNAFWSSETTKCFVALVDNYERETGKAERVGREEKQEMDNFLDALCDTKVRAACAVISVALRSVQRSRVQA